MKMKMMFCEADPQNPFKVARSHLNRDMLKKSTSSCRAALVFRPHRRASLQELLCDSWEEHEVALNIAALPDVIHIKEQAVTVPYENALGRKTRQRIDLLCGRTDGRVFAVSVKYAGKARRPSYLAEIRALNLQLPSDVADKAVVLSRQSFHPSHNQNAKLINFIRRGWDPEADHITLDAARHLVGDFKISDLFGRTGLEEARTFRSAVRLIGDGDLRLTHMCSIDEATMCRGAA